MLEFRYQIPDAETGDKGRLQEENERVVEAIYKNMCDNYSK